MKKLIIRTAIITFVSALVIAAAVFGICSLAAPAAMMKFTASLGWTGASGDYAYSAYEKTGELSYLAYACDAADRTNGGKAVERYEILIKAEGFDEYCKQEDERTSSEHIKGTYSQYVSGRYACVLYREGDTEKAIETAAAAVKEEFPENNAVIALSTEIIGNKDKAACGKLAEQLKQISGIQSDENCRQIIKVLEECAS